MIHITRIDSKGIRMSFRLQKCGWLVSKIGKMIRTEGAELSEGNKADVHSYKYRGVPQQMETMTRWLGQTTYIEPGKP